MNKGVKIGLYVMGALAALTGTYFLLRKREPEEDNTSESGGDTGASTPQTQPTQLNAVLRTPLAVTALKGKNVYAKNNETKGRTEPYVNDGLLNNINFIKYSTQGPVGTITGVFKDDEGKAKSPQGYVYKWVEIAISEGAADEYNRNAPWYEASNKKAGQKTLMREDVIRL